MNRRKIIKEFSHNATPSFSFCPCLCWQNDKNISSLENVYEARKLLMEALAEDPEVGRIFFRQIIFTVEGSKNLANALCNCINAAFSASWGVAVLKTSAQGYFKRKESFQISIHSWADRIHEPSYFLGLFSSRDNFINLSCWTHPLIQAITEKINATENQEKRNKLLASAEALLSEETPAVPLFDVQFISLCHSHVQGIYSSRLQRFDIRFASKKGLEQKECGGVEEMS